MTRRRIMAAAAVLAILAESAALIALGAFLGDPGPQAAQCAAINQTAAQAARNKES